MVVSSFILHCVLLLSLASLLIGTAENQFKDSPLSKDHDEALTFASKGELERARILLGTINTESTTNSRLLNDKGVIDMRLGFELLDAAVKTFEQGLTIDPTNQALLTNLHNLQAYLDEAETHGKVIGGVADATNRRAPPPPPPAPAYAAPYAAPGERPDSQRDLVERVMGSWLKNNKVQRHARRAFGMFRPIQITNCFTDHFAEKLHRELNETKDFTFYEGNSPFYQFRLNAIYDDDHSFQRHPMLIEALAALNSDTVLDWIADVSNSDIERASLGASLYKPGDHTQAHTDMKDNNDGTKRRVAYITHLTKNWDPTFGGDLVKMTPTTHLLPLFNAITLFPVTLGGWHYVSPVTKRAEYPKYKRLAVSGWFMSEQSDNNIDEMEELGADREERFGYWHVNGNSGKKISQVNQMSFRKLQSLWGEKNKEKEENDGTRKKRRRKKKRKRGMSDKSEEKRREPRGEEKKEKRKRKEKRKEKRRRKKKKRPQFTHEDL